jgi:hypothetical protein
MLAATRPHSSGAAHREARASHAAPDTPPKRPPCPIVAGYDSFMSSHSEPSVETLTAEVRVLQVGSKPVTLSTARQLDFADPSEIRPFGRVRIDPKPAKNLIEVIGATDDGALARSSATFREVECPGYATKAYHHSHLPPQVVCPRHRRTPAADAAGQRHGWVEYTPSKEVYDAWEALPLIVLAGLR